MVSIIVPTYNRGYIINRTLDSIKNQSYQEWECVIIDDHSDDDTNEVVSKFIEKDHRFIYVVNERTKGAQGARNTGLLRAKGEYVCFFDSDNVMHPDFLKKHMIQLKKECVDICGSFSRVIDKDTNQVDGMFDWKGYGRIHSNLMTGKSYFDNSSTLIRKQKLLDIGLLDENCPSYQEWDTHIRLSKICTYTMVEEPLVDYYRGGEDSISASIEKDIKGLLYLLKKYEREWVLCYPKAYIKKVNIVFQNLQSLKGKEIYNELSLIYINSVRLLFRQIAFMIYTRNRVKL